ncbi:MAG: TIGR02584 family CRISPR-associated protein [Kiritimatiellaeota bacterium]|nr:TIGR02584 family CRISPR-associated protein [Kiritimatiellota bacterium]
MKKKILIAMCGMSPGVVTETVYALSKNGKTPDKVVVVTTTAGRRKIREDLLDSGVWSDLEKIIGAHKIEFGDSHDHIRLIPTSDAGNADDIITTADNARCADFILNVLREFTENPETAISFSIAGGRKTMSVLGALAMSLLGRENDKLYHILVNPPFDSPALEPKFHYPVPELTHKAPDGRLHSSADAELSLCEIPFTRIRYLFQNEFARLPGDFNSTVELANKRISGRIDPPELKIIPERMEMFFDSKRVRFNCAEFVMYWMLAERCKAAHAPIHGQTALQEEYADFADNVDASVMPEIINHPALVKKDEGDMRKIISTISAKIRNALTIEEGRDAALPTIGRGVYALALPSDNIVILR